MNDVIMKKKFSETQSHAINTTVTNTIQHAIESDSTNNL